MDFSDHALANVLNSLHDGLYFTDTDRRIIYWNAAAERITGYASPEVLGKKCSDNILVHIDAEGTNLCKNLCPLAKTIEDGAHREADHAPPPSAAQRGGGQDSQSRQQTRTAPAGQAGGSHRGGKAAVGLYRGLGVHYGLNRSVQLHNLLFPGRLVNGNLN